MLYSSVSNCVAMLQHLSVYSLGMETTECWQRLGFHDWHAQGSVGR